MLSFEGNLQKYLSDISFCDKKCNNLNNNDSKEKLISYLKTNYNIDVVDRLFNYLNPSILRNVTYNQHLIGTLTNGNPYLLYLLRVDGTNCCFYIDRKLKNGYQYPKIHYVNYQFHDSLFDGTLFSGELVRDNQRRWFYLIDNLMIYKGKKITDKNIVCRYEHIYDIFNNCYTQNKLLESCPIQIKKLFHYSQIKKLVNQFLPSLSYQCKGLLFYNLNNKYSNYALLFSRNEPILPLSKENVEKLIKTNKPTLWAKMRNKNENTNNIEQSVDYNNISSLKVNEDLNKKLNLNNVIFKVLNTDMPDIYNLYINDQESNELIKYDLALIPNLRTSKYLRNLFESNTNILDIKMECEYSKIFKKWKPIRESKMAISSTQEMENCISNY